MCFGFWYNLISQKPLLKIPEGELFSCKFSPAGRHAHFRLLLSDCAVHVILAINLCFSTGHSTREREPLGDLIWATNSNGTKYTTHIFILFYCIFGLYYRSYCENSIVDIFLNLCIVLQNSIVCNFNLKLNFIEKATVKIIRF